MCFVNVNTIFCKNYLEFSLIALYNTLYIAFLLQITNFEFVSILSVVEPECEKSSATTYYWYREALNISNSISESGGLNWKMTICLLAAWVMVCLAMIKGIQSSGKVSLYRPSSHLPSEFLPHPFT